MKQRIAPPQFQFPVGIQAFLSRATPNQGPPPLPSDRTYETESAKDLKKLCESSCLYAILRNARYEVQSGFYLFKDINRSLRAPNKSCRLRPPRIPSWDNLYQNCLVLSAGYPASVQSMRQASASTSRSPVSGSFHLSCQ